MTVLRAILFRLSYQLRGHRWNGWPLDYWLTFALVLVVGLAWLDIVPGQRVTIYGVGVVLLVLWGLLLWAKFNQYVIFLAEVLPSSPGPVTLMNPTDKLQLRATGTFEVEGEEKTFTDLLAYYRTFGTREHAVMAIVPPSRFLLLGTRSAQEVGMWYIFFRPHTIIDLRPGTLHFGLRARPALRVARQGDKGQKIVYLSFDDHSARQQVWADLERDAPGGLAA
jgi:hypothetical protein